MSYTRQVKSVWEILYHSKKEPEVTLDAQFCIFHLSEVQKQVFVA